MNKSGLILAWLVVNIFLAAAVCAEQEYYVQSKEVKILASPNFKSPEIAAARMGQMLTSLGNEGNWLKVRLDGKEGYIPSLLVATHPPFNKTSLIKADAPEIKQGVHRRASSFASAGAARGLTKEDRRRADDEEAADYKSLQNLEELAFNDDEVTEFIGGRQH